MKEKLWHGGNHGNSRQQGMKTLKQRAVTYLDQGITTMDEVMKVAYYEE